MKRELLVLLVCLSLLAVAICWDVGDTEQSVETFTPEKYAGQTVILDPGHGGEDGGAVSAGGDKESDINLSIALRTDQIMGLCGLPVVLTRSEDISIHDPSASTLREKKVSDIHNRVKLVDETEGAVLLSIHQNSYSDPRYSGAQVFYGANQDSKLWGENTQEVLRTTLNEANTRAAKQIPDTVYLMNHINCPAILVECGFMSNGEEASLLQTAGYQKKIATALTGACLQYLQMTA